MNVFFFVFKTFFFLKKSKTKTHTYCKTARKIYSYLIHINENGFNWLPSSICLIQCIIPREPMDTIVLPDKVPFGDLKYKISSKIGPNSTTFQDTLTLCFYIECRIWALEIYSQYLFAGAKRFRIFEDFSFYIQIHFVRYKNHWSTFERAEAKTKFLTKVNNSENQIDHRNFQYSRARICQCTALISTIFTTTQTKSELYEWYLFCINLLNETKNSKNEWYINVYQQKNWWASVQMLKCHWKWRVLVLNDFIPQ